MNGQLCTVVYLYLHMLVEHTKMKNLYYRLNMNYIHSNNPKTK